MKKFLIILVIINVQQLFAASDKTVIFYTGTCNDIDTTQSIFVTDVEGQCGSGNSNRKLGVACRKKTESPDPHAQIQWYGVNIKSNSIGHQRFKINFICPDAEYCPKEDVFTDFNEPSGQCKFPSAGTHNATCTLKHDLGGEYDYTIQIMGNGNNVECELDPHIRID